MDKIKTDVERLAQNDGTEIVVCGAEVPREQLLSILTDAGFEVSPSGRFLIVDNNSPTVSIRSSGVHAPDPAEMPQTPTASTKKNPAKNAGPQTLQYPADDCGDDPDFEVEC